MRSEQYPMRLPSLPAKIPTPSFELARLRRGRSGGADLVGLDIQPGLVAAVQARVNGSVVAERAAALSLPADTVRDGEVVDEAVLAETLRELFADSGLGRRVRVGVANQRTVLRTLELPPVTDAKELAAAVTFQAQDQVPMPLGNAVLDFHPLGIVDTPSGPRQRVVLVAAQKDMIEKLLAAVRAAGLRPEGVDLSAFALIRALHRHDPDAGRVLYLNVDGLTNLAIAEGTVCRFTRVVGGGLEGMAVEVAERRGIALAEARELVAGVNLLAPPVAEPPRPARAPEPAPAAAPVSEPHAGAAQDEDSIGFLETLADQVAEESAAAPAVQDAAGDVFGVVESGIRDISGEVRNSLDFHRSQDGGGEVSHVVLSGAAEEIPGFAEALERALGVAVRAQSVSVVGEQPGGHVSAHRLAVATGLATAEAPQ